MSPTRLAVLAGLVAVLGLAAPAAVAQQRQDTVDVAALAERLRQDPVQRLPGAFAWLDADRVRSELERTVPVDAGGTAESRVYVVVAPSDQAVDLDELSDQLDPGDEVVAVWGLHVTLPSWDRYVRGNDDGRTGDLIRDNLNRRYERIVPLTHDVTGPVSDALRVIRDEPLGEYLDGPGSADRDSSAVDTVVDALRAGSVYVDPEVATDPDPRRWDPFPDGPPPGSVGYKVAYLPASRDGTRSVQYELARAFPDDIVIVIEGHLLRAGGPGATADIGSAEVRAWRLVNPAEYDGGRYPTPRQAVRVFVDRLIEQRGGTLSPASEAARLVGAAAFALTGAAIALLSVGLWGLLRWRGAVREARAFRVGSARVAADLAKLAAGIDTVADARHRALASERYTTARDLVERASTSGQLAAAREVLAEGCRLVELPPPAPDPRPAKPERSRWHRDRFSRPLIWAGVVNAFLSYLPFRNQKLFQQDFEATTIGAVGSSIVALSVGGYLVLRGGAPNPPGRPGTRPIRAAPDNGTRPSPPLSTRTLQGWGIGLILGSGLPGLVALDAGDLLPIVILAVVLGLFFLFRGRLANRLAEPSTRRWDRVLCWAGAATAAYAVFGFYAERAGNGDLFRAAVVAGYGAVGVLVAFWLFVLLVEQRSRLESRQRRRRERAAARATALADLLRLAAVVTGPRGEPGELGEQSLRYAEAMDAFERARRRADFEQVSGLVAAALPREPARG